MNITSFDDLLRAARNQAEPQRLLFVFANADSDQSLKSMIEAIKTGAFGSFMPFDRQGQPLLFS